MRTVRFWNFPNQVGSKKKDHSYKNKKNYTSNGEDGEREFNQNLSIHFQWQPKKIVPIICKTNKYCNIY